MEEEPEFEMHEQAPHAENIWFFKNQS
jgi:hypothetical protein